MSDQFYQSFFDYCHDSLLSHFKNLCGWGLHWSSLMSSLLGLMPTTQSAYRQGHSTWDGCDEDLQRHVACCRLWPTDRCLSTRPYSGVRHRRPWPTTASVGTAVWSPRSCAPVVSLLPFRQVFPCALQQSDILCCLHCVLMPQGSILGPRLFIFYTADLADKVEQHQVNMHAYADDTQLYLHCRRDDTTAVVTRLEICLNHVSHWMAANRLKLNVEKTELLWAGSVSYTHLTLPTIYSV